VKLSLITLSLQVAAAVVVQGPTQRVAAAVVLVAIVLHSIVKHLVVEDQARQD